METEFSEAKLDSLIQEALSPDNSKLHPKSGMYLGFMETDLLEIVYKNLTGLIHDSALASAFKEIRSELLSRKVNYKIKDFHTVTKNCTKCDVGSISPELPKWNTKDPDVLFVIDSPNMQQEVVNLFLKLLKAAGFDSSKVCLTYVNRCPARRKFTNQEIYNCSPYLHTEIQLLNPKLIVTLGSLPATVLFGNEIKIKEYRGNITWLGYWPIITTYSLAYALKAGQSIIDHILSDIKTAHTFVNKGEKIL
ncbi:uracil-DNA glycosylase family protein [Flavobacterium sp.]|uniref:uracil-DNA glycosylase family protein n=1 Tax=Flavobacterium sp. TaxID=239 RepID=UPI003BE6A50F